MRKILASLMATVMVTSICATATFATTNTSAMALTTIKGDLVQEYEAAKLAVFIVVDGYEGQIYEFPFSFSYKTGALSPEDVSKSLDGQVLNNLKIGDRRYDITLEQYQLTGVLIATVTPDIMIPQGTGIGIGILDENGYILKTNGVPPNDNEAMYGFLYDHPLYGYPGSGGLTVDLETTGEFATMDLGEVFECDGQGNLIPLTEKGVGVDKDLNGQGGVQSNKTLYFMIKKGLYNFDDDTFWELEIDKGHNRKMIKSVSDVSKNFSEDFYHALNDKEMEDTSGRNRFIKVELNENYTDDEYKIDLDLCLTPTTKAMNVYKDLKGEVSIKIKDFVFYMKNIVQKANNDWKVGINGLMLEPIKNDWNTVTYFDEDGDVAYLNFFGDSDVEKFYSKLSTKWAHADYAAYFNDQDAYYFEFTGLPQISATSRADLQIYNPFKDDNGNETIDPKTATIYQVIDGDLVDVTASFTYGEGANGDNAFIARTRFLGNYIICEKPIKEAVSTKKSANIA